MAATCRCILGPIGPLNAAGNNDLVVTRLELESDLTIDADVVDSSVPAGQAVVFDVSLLCGGSIRTLSIATDGDPRRRWVTARGGCSDRERRAF